MYNMSKNSLILMVLQKEQKTRTNGGYKHSDNALSNKNFLHYFTFRMLQHTSSEVNGYNCYKHLKNTKIKRGTGDKIKNNDEIDTTDS